MAMRLRLLPHLAGLGGFKAPACPQLQPARPTPGYAACQAHSGYNSPLEVRPLPPEALIWPEPPPLPLARGSPPPAVITMHEMSICEGILQVLETTASQQGFRQVRTVWLEIGPLAGVEVEALRFCFEAVMRGSLAEAARLEIIETPGEGVCLQCGATVPVRQRYDPCPACGGYGVRLTRGEEMRIKELEVE